MKYLSRILLIAITFSNCTQKSGINNQKSSTAKPNVIFILTDDQGYGDLSCHGNPILKTPAMDKLYNEAVVFTDLHVSSICTPTRSQLMTGVDACRNGAFAWAYSREIIHSDVPVMPVLKKMAMPPGTLGNGTWAITTPTVLSTWVLMSR